MLQDKRFKNRELQMMRMLAKKDHPNIVSLKHCFYSNGDKVCTAVVLVSAAAAFAAVAAVVAAAAAATTTTTAATLLLLLLLLLEMATPQHHPLACCISSRNQDKARTTCNSDVCTYLGLG